MSFIYNEAKRALAEGEIDLGADDIRVMLVMSDTTADTEKDADDIADFTTLDEHDGANYVRKALASETVTEDAPNNRAEFDADDVVYTALGVGARPCVAAIVYLHVATDADHEPIAYIDTGGFPFVANGGNVTIQWNVQGIIQIT